jgi:hypothetical protein
MRHKPAPLDPDTASAISQALTVARKGGGDPGEVLQRSGLVLSPAAAAAIRAEAIAFLWHEAQRWTPAEFLRRKNRTLEGCTPTDMYHAILEWMAEHAQAAKEFR